MVLVPGTVKFKETAESAKSHDYDGFDSDWIQYSFTAWAKCTYPSCQQEYAIAGTGGVQPEMTSETDWDYVDYFKPAVCTPMPDMFPFPKNCPDDVVHELRAAFSLFWLNREASAGRLRVAVECLMNHLGVPGRKKTQNGRYKDLTLHARIDMFATKQPNEGEKLMALKWLGNSGSHADTVRDPFRTSELLDAFEVMEDALKELIGGHSKKVAALARKLTKKHKKKKK